MAAIGVLTLELRIDHAHSLKDKRQIVRSLEERLRGRFNVSVAEIGYQDLWRRGLLAAVTIASARVPAEAVLQRVEREAAAQLGGMLAATGIEWLE